MSRNPGKLLTQLRRFVIRILQDTEDDLEGIVPIPEPTGKATLQEIRDNHLYHQALAINGLHIRVGRVEAKIGLLLSLAFGLFGLAARPVLEMLLKAVL